MSAAGGGQYVGRIEYVGDPDSAETAYLLNPSLTIRVACLGDWIEISDGFAAWVNDAPDGNEREVDSRTEWYAAVEALADQLIAK